MKSVEQTRRYFLRRQMAWPRIAQEGNYRFEAGEAYPQGTYLGRDPDRVTHSPGYRDRPSTPGEEGVRMDPTGHQARQQPRAHTLL